MIEQVVYYTETNARSPICDWCAAAFGRSDPGSAGKTPQPANHPTLVGPVGPAGRLYIMVPVGTRHVSRRRSNLPAHVAVAVPPKEPASRKSQTAQQVIGHVPQALSGDGSHGGPHCEDTVPSSR